jgi:hypothetical protein
MRAASFSADWQPVKLTPSASSMMTVFGQSPFDGGDGDPHVAVA